jgi:hypothetical protein
VSGAVWGPRYTGRVCERAGVNEWYGEVVFLCLDYGRHVFCSRLLLMADVAVEQLMTPTLLSCLESLEVVIWEILMISSALRASTSA